MRSLQFQFDTEIAERFELEIEGNIPFLESLRWWDFELAKLLLRPGDLCVDLGCSIGSSFDPLAVDQEVDFVGVDDSEPMIERARKRFASASNVSFEWGDVLAFEYPRRARLTLLVLTLHFVELDHRPELLRTVCANSEYLILVEKTIVEHEDLITGAYYGYKRLMGVDEDWIQRKRRLLEGVLVPLSPEEDEMLLREAGFTKISRFWAGGPFIGWICS